MKKASELANGTLFVGYCDFEDLHAAPRCRFAGHDGKQKRLPATADVRALLTVHGDAITAREIAEIFSALPHDHPQQICNGLSVWIAGERRNGGCVRVIAWYAPHSRRCTCPASHDHTTLGHLPSCRGGVR